MNLIALSILAIGMGWLTHEYDDGFAGGIAIIASLACIILAVSK